MAALGTFRSGPSAFGMVNAAGEATMDWYRSATTLDRALLVTTAGTVGIALVMSYIAVLTTMVLG